MEVRKFDEQTPKPQLGNWDMRKRPKLYQSRIQKPHDQTREAIQTNKQKKPIIQILLQNQNPDKKNQMRTLQAIAILSFFSHNIENRINKLGAFGVMALSPVISGTRLAENEVIGAEDLAERAGSDGVHGTRLEIHEDRTRDEATAAGLVVIDIDSLELELGVAVVFSGVVNAVLVADHLPELGSDLVATLTALDV